MPKPESSENDDDSNYSSSGDEPTQTQTPLNTNHNQGLSDYEEQRLFRIQQNTARLQALGLPKLSSSLLGPSPKRVNPSPKPKPKPKPRKLQDDDYRPPHENDVSTSSTESDDSGSSKAKHKNSKPKKKASVQKLMSNSDFMDEDDALMQAIALSLQDSVENSGGLHSGPSHNPDRHPADDILIDRKENAQIKEDRGKRKRKQPITRRAQMTEDELVVHFFQFDEAGRGSISLRDIRRVAMAHDFTWTDKEMADMIHCFDNDGDGKLSLDDFRKIVSRCNMLQDSENPATASNS